MNSKRRCRYIWIFLLLFHWLLLHGADAKLSDEVFETVLDNGLKIILVEDHRVPMVSFQLWYRVGSRDDSWEKTGLSHMMEHMMYKGTEKVGSEEYSRIVQRNGGDDNAFTTQDYTTFFVNISADKINIPMELESDRMKNLVLREEDFRTEKMVILEERRLTTEDDPQAYLVEQMNALAFLTSAYRWPVIGWKQDIEHMTLDDVREHRRLYYHPSNAFLIVSGDFKKKEVLGEIEKAFGIIPRGNQSDKLRRAELPQVGERRIIVKKEAELPCLVIGYHVPNLNDPDGYVLEVISALLSRGKSSRLYRNLVIEKNMLLDVEVDNPLFSGDPHLFSIFATVALGQDVREAEKAVHDEILALQNTPVETRELEKVKNQLEADFLFSQDSLFYRAMLLGQHEIVAGWRKVDDYIPSIRNVTPEDIQRVAKKYLHEDNRTVGLLMPITK